MQKKIKNEKLAIDIILENFISLSFINEIFDFVFDMGCFHHIAIIEICLH